MIKYILDYTTGDSLDFTEETVNELEAFGHSYEVVEIADSATELN